MSHQKYYSIITAFIALFCTYFLPWWTIPFGIAVLAYFTNISVLKAASIALAITAFIWMAWAGFQEMSAVNKVSALTGKLFFNISSIYIYMFTGISISLVTAMAAASGRGIWDIVNDYQGK